MQSATHSGTSEVFSNAYPLEGDELLPQIIVGDLNTKRRTCGQTHTLIPYYRHSAVHVGPEISQV